MNLIKNVLKKWLEKIDSNSKMFILKWEYKKYWATITLL